uniref:Peptidase A2 domain-containing protein n=1 Tax=Heterorhabditis bacteriophora TaxID=37862 RepID=A0A1I7WGT3_HETBA
MEMTNTHTQLSQLESKDIAPGSVQYGKNNLFERQLNRKSKNSYQRFVVRTHVDKCYIPKIPRHYSRKNTYDKPRKKRVYGTIGARYRIEIEIKIGYMSKEKFDRELHILWSTPQLSVADSYNRRQILIEKRACWKCFSSKHNSYECQEPRCSICRGEHHSTVCSRTHTEHIRQGAENRNRYSQNRSNGRQRNVGPPYAGTGQNTLPPVIHRPSPMMQRPGEENFIQRTYDIINQSHVSEDHVYHQAVLMTAEGKVKNKNGTYENVIVFLDTGAQQSLIEEAEANRLGLAKKNAEYCTMSGIGGITESFTSYEVQLDIMSAYGTKIIIKVKTKPVLTKGFNAVYLTPKDKEFLLKHDIILSNPKVNGEKQIPKILIGIDLYQQFVLHSTPQELPSGLCLLRTVLGRCVYGRGQIKYDSDQSTDTKHMVTGVCIEEITESDMLKNMFDLEGLGIRTDEFSQDDSTYQYYEQYKKT